MSLVYIRVFKRWVTREGLLSIRKTGKYDYSMNHKYNKTLTFTIENETDLHVKVISFFIKKRIDSWKKGYIRGSPDLITNNLHKHYTGFAIAFKSPSGYGSLSEDQCGVLQQYENNCFKTLVSNDYDHIIEQLIEYFRNVRVKCLQCSREFISSQSLNNHLKSFHKMS